VASGVPVPGAHAKACSRDVLLPASRIPLASLQAWRSPSSHRCGLSRSKTPPTSHWQFSLAHAKLLVDAQGGGGLLAAWTTCCCCTFGRHLRAAAEQRWSPVKFRTSFSSCCPTRQRPSRHIAQLPRSKTVVEFRPCATRWGPIESQKGCQKRISQGFVFDILDSVQASCERAHATPHGQRLLLSRLIGRRPFRKLVVCGLVGAAGMVAAVDA
jgi:hypothetical protein